MRSAGIVFYLGQCLVFLGMGLASGCIDTTILSSGCDGGPTLCGCRSDSDCLAAAPRCNPSTNMCVPCLPQMDNCTAGNKCLPDGPGNYRCAMNCISASDCPSFGDAGVGGPAACCSQACVSLLSDPQNCGMCGRTCPVPVNGKAGCSSSTCTIASCNTGYADCNRNGFDGCEVDTTSDARNCGKCGASCSTVKNGTDTCQAGKCTSACNPGYADCNGNALDGCEVDITSDTQNCGSCQNLCLTLPNATSVCAVGACVISSCVSGHLDCNFKNADGCEVNSSLDVNNCGACGMVCGAIPNAVVGCEGGACGIGNCNTNFGDCNGQVADGCETSLKADNKNCGGCGHICALAQATSTCTSGACAITGCSGGYADCDHAAANGCEARLGSDFQNCGACGNTCPIGVNGVTSCVNASCAVVSCDQGYADCDKSPANGCETNTNKVNNCGSCGTVCMLGGSCINGKCVAAITVFSYAATVNYTVGTFPASVALGDLNGDGKLDVATANYTGNNTSVLMGNGTGALAAAVNYAAGSGSDAVGIGDLNGDGKLDLAVANTVDGNESVLVNNGNGTFGPFGNHVTGQHAYSVALGDLNGDGKLDIAVANNSANNVSVLLSTGNGNFAAAVNYAVGTGPESVVVGDVNSDGKLDLAIANFGTNNVSILLNNGNGTFAAAVNYAAGTGAASVAISDLNNDGKPDLAVANSTTDNVSVLLNNGNGTFGAPTNFAVGNYPVSVMVGDLNSDGKSDLAVANYSDSNVSVLLGNGNGTFAAAVNFAVSSGPQQVAIGDLNSDGKGDLVVACASNSVSVLLNTSH